MPFIVGDHSPEAQNVSHRNGLEVKSSSALWPCSKGDDPNFGIRIFSNAVLASRLAFRGGTALHKLLLNPASRYSEDIDLVQVKPEPIGLILTDLHRTLDPWLGEPRRKQSEGRATLVYHFDSEIAPITPLRLKVEINTREHFAVFGYLLKKFRVKSPWFNGEAEITKQRWRTFQDV